ncbi:GntR family transcriptional regulator [Sphingobium sp. V4]|uniref:GntR family transcriptional regulator n=1 Tax=Sphingobium sp. V4 TaxID=3038927 RepID=UPI00255826F5|nr:GntR family transcriptional regulator [Sphingobium sp. V4]WIW89565.1 GntR family transcriptional regulator [Sphingobium sp. V4]
MSPEPITAERTYQQLKQEIVVGDHKPGIQLNLQRLADRFGTSVTPVRDAVHRMVGERFLELHPGGGFHLPVPTAEWLHDLYEWNDQLVRQALRRPLPEEAIVTLAEFKVEHNDPRQLACWASTFFSLVAFHSCNAEFVHAIENVSDRLLLARLKEPALLKSMSGEAESMVAVAKDGSASAIRRAVWEYHRRRLRRTDRIAAALISG